MLAQQIYPLCFIWKTDFWTTLGTILKDAARPRSEGLIEKAKALLPDRPEDTLPPLARVIGGTPAWDAIMENARLSPPAVARGLAGRLGERGRPAQVARLPNRRAGHTSGKEPR